MIVQQKPGQSISGDAHVCATLVHVKTKSARSFRAQAPSLNFLLPHELLLQPT